MLVKIKSLKEIERINNDFKICLSFVEYMKDLCGKIFKVKFTHNKNHFIMIKPHFYYDKITGEKDSYKWLFHKNWFDVIPEQLELEF